ncbi:MAG TPA: CPBP family intramembrane glutamic endopeptidase [Candidatus Acidoferrales bacterium]|jgi:membrane protease YdiL (CAAX protease family)|nr:CPBP family intramembrane glutamic endopeptidase [Candidatus Acidoferrales bacterium]
MPSAIGKRVIAFIQSVRPADPAHILLLLGATFLFIAHELRWWPLAARNSWVIDWEVRWRIAVVLIALPMLAAGATAGYLCLFGVQKPVRILVRAVLLPALVSLVAIPVVGLIWFSQLLLSSDPAAESILEANHGAVATILQVPGDLGPGLQIAALGFILMVIFTWLVGSGRTTQPLRLRFSSSPFTVGASIEDDHRTGMFIWMMICFVPLANLLQSVLFVLLTPFGSFVASISALRWTDRIFGALSQLALVVLALGRDRVTALNRSILLGPPEYTGIGALIPAGLACAWPLVRLFLDVNHYLVGFGGDRPKLGEYAAAPSASLLWFFVPAFIEEIAWRGYLQPRLVRRYGIMRGIFFVGVVWGAFHFAGDFQASMNSGGVLLHIAQRLTEMIAISYVLGWLTMRSGSILPAAVAHGVFNISLEAGFFSGLVLPVWVIALAWGIVGYLLFRYFPPDAISGEGTAVPAPNLEAAT